MPSTGDIAAALIAGEKVAEGHGEAGVLTKLLTWFRITSREAPVAERTVAQAAGPPAVDIGQRFDEGWNAHWDAVAAALKAPIDDEPS